MEMLWAFKNKQRKNKDQYKMKNSHNNKKSRKTM